MDRTFSASVQFVVWLSTVIPFGQEPSESPFGMEGESAHPGRGLAGLSEQPEPMLNPLASRPVTPGARTTGVTAGEGDGVALGTVGTGAGVGVGAATDGVGTDDAGGFDVAGLADPVEPKTPPT